ncbi:hypothetical protein AB2M62_06125 [Sphingomonas sp. MMS12-HWE2-04]|uniref:hypothetical protein n=1 Tax=Sphingomonas sp. MMS12-HWE2-04 TaxID=3234199 RepID=UPI00384B94FD
MKKSIASIYGGAPSLRIHQNGLMLQRIVDYAEAPRSLASYRGILIAALMSLAFWAGVFEAIF